MGMGPNNGILSSVGDFEKCLEDPPRVFHGLVTTVVHPFYLVGGLEHGFYFSIYWE